MLTRQRLLVCLLGAISFACGGGDVLDAGARDASRGGTDAAVDAGFIDDGGRDSGPVDSGPVEVPDAGVDAGGPCGVGGASRVITGDGSVSVTSVFGGAMYPGVLAVDGDRTTSWFSVGSADVTPTLTWTLPSDACIETIEFLNNAMHSNLSFRTDFGFNTVTIEVRATPGGEVVWSEMSSLAGRPDPDILVTPGGVRGREIALIFAMHDDTRCGGFSELNVTGLE